MPRSFAFSPFDVMYVIKNNHMGIYKRIIDMTRQQNTVIYI